MAAEFHRIAMGDQYNFYPLDRVPALVSLPDDAGASNESEPDMLEDVFED